MQLRIQSQIRSYKGKASTVFAFYDDDTGKLIVGKEMGFFAGRKKGIDVLISDSDVEQRDSLFSDDKMMPAVTAFYLMSSDNSIQIDASVMRCNPEAAIEFEGIVNGKKTYRIMPEISNAQVATLAISHYVQSSRLIDDTLIMADTMSKLLSGKSITI